MVIGIENLFFKYNLKILINGSFCIIVMLIYILIYMHLNILNNNNNILNLYIQKKKYTNNGIFIKYI